MPSPAGGLFLKLMFFHGNNWNGTDRQFQRVRTIDK